MTFKQFLIEYTDWTKKYQARHQKKNGLYSGFVNKPRKGFNLVAQYRKDKLQVNPAIQQLKEQGGMKVCTPSDIAYIRETYPQIDLASVGAGGASLGKTGIVLRKIGGKFVMKMENKE